ncbi:MAG: thioredoxin family protein [Clostridia bacterium]|nr:thioredoxin family protein [Clostridia bacterium]
MQMIDVTRESFQREVAEYPGTVLLDFFADRCSACRAMTPVLEDVASSDANVKICKVDVDQNRALAEAFGILSLPTLVVMKNGEIRNRSIGVTRKKAILDMLE